MADTLTLALPRPAPSNAKDHGPAKQILTAFDASAATRFDFGRQRQTDTVEAPLLGYYLSLNAARALSGFEGCRMGVARALLHVELPARMRPWVQQRFNSAIQATKVCAEAALPLSAGQQTLPPCTGWADEWLLNDVAVQQTFAGTTGSLATWLAETQRSPLAALTGVRLLARAYELGLMPPQGLFDWLKTAPWPSHEELPAALARLERATGVAAGSLQANTRAATFAAEDGPDRSVLAFLSADAYDNLRLPRAENGEHSLYATALVTREFASAALLREVVQHALQGRGEQRLQAVLCRVTQSFRRSQRTLRSDGQLFAEIILACSPWLGVPGNRDRLTVLLLARLAHAAGIDVVASAHKLTSPYLRDVGTSTARVTTASLRDGTLGPALRGCAVSLDAVLGQLQYFSLRKATAKHFSAANVCSLTKRKVNARKTFSEFIAHTVGAMGTVAAPSPGAVSASYGAEFVRNKTPFHTVFSHLLWQRLRLNRTPPRFADLSPAQRNQLLEALQSWEHVGCAALLCAYTVSDPGRLWDTYRGAYPRGHDADLAMARGETLWRSLCGLSPHAQAVALFEVANPASSRQVDEFLALDLRLLLVGKAQLDKVWLAQACRPYADAPSTLLSALGHRLAQASLVAPAQHASDAEAVGDYLEALYANGEIEAAEVQGFVAANGVAVFPDRPWADRLGRASDVNERARISQALARHVHLRNDPTTAEAGGFAVMQGLWQADKRRVPSLRAVDAELAAQAAREAAGHAGPATPTAPTVTIEGIALPMRSTSQPGGEGGAVPNAQVAELVLTPTTRQNLKRIAALWACREATLLEGPTSAGKTSLVRYLAYKTQLAYRRVSLSHETDVSDLLGRYVGGEVVHTPEQLRAMDAAALRALADTYGVRAGDALDGLRHAIFDAQQNPRWVDGVVVQAMRAGEVLLLDEINLARPEVLERLNSLFDDDVSLVLTEHANEKVRPHTDFRCFASMNPSSYAGRAQLSDAASSRWRKLYCTGPTRADLQAIVDVRYADRVPLQQRKALVAAHQSLASAAENGEFNRSTGGVSFTLRNLFRTCERLARFANCGLSPNALLLREVGEVYLDGLLEACDDETARTLLRLVLPAQDPNAVYEQNIEGYDVASRKVAHFYHHLASPQVVDGTVVFGDLRLPVRDGLDPGEAVREPLVATKRTLRLLYSLAKALHCGENVALVGDSAGGKTALAQAYASLVGLTCFRQIIDRDTDAASLVGGYKERGWGDGLLLTACRPTGRGGVLLLDEFNLGSSSLLERLNAVLDDERQLVLTEKEGERIALHRDFQFVAAMNPPTRAYPGRKRLSAALSNRFTTLMVPPMALAEQREVTLARARGLGLDDAVSEALYAVAHHAFVGYRDGTLGRNLRAAQRPSLTIRELLAAVRLTARLKQQLGEGEAFFQAVDLCYAAGPDGDDADAIRRFAENCAENGADLL